MSIIDRFPPILPTSTISHVGFNGEDAIFKIKSLILESPTGEKVEINPTLHLCNVIEMKINGYKPRLIPIYRDPEKEAQQDKLDTDPMKVDSYKCIRHVRPELSKEEYEKMPHEEQEKLSEEVDLFFSKKQEEFLERKKLKETVELKKKEESEKWNKKIDRIVKGIGGACTVIVVIEVIQRIYGIYLKKNSEFPTYLLSLIKERIWKSTN